MKQLPRLIGDLSSLVANLRDRPGDRVARLVLADWLDQYLPPSELNGQLPPNFNLWWHQSGNAKKHHGGYFCGRLNAGEIEHDLQMCVCHQRDCVPFHWFDHGGAIKIGGVPVFVTEPYAWEDQLPLATETLQHAVQCPVAFSRVAHWHPRCVRLLFFFTESLSLPG